MYVCIYICIYVYTFIYIYIYVYMHSHTHPHTRTHTQDLLLSAHRLAMRLPHSPLALAPLLPRDLAMARAAEEIRALTNWGGRAGEAMLGAAAQLSRAAQGDVKMGELGEGSTVENIPFVHADGSVGFRHVGGGGYGFGDWHPSTPRLAR